MSRILVVEDDPRLSAVIEKGLRAAEMTPTVVADGRSALDYAMTGEFDLMILDLGLPVMDGLTVLRELRAARVRLPVIVLTARVSLDDTIASLEGGADDYMPKPFRFDELLARIRLRLPAAGVHGPETMILGDGGLVLNLHTRQATVDGRSVQLSGREFLLAETLLRHAGQVLSRQQILDRVWGIGFDPGTNIVDVYIRYLRRKLGQRRIESVWGVGYRLVPERPDQTGDS
ncbi:response regulator transcription factor [Jiangella alkaliphila]|uniref:DNA-binding response regulator, OmpR family, contains REC and winged-helix (WHTH) domain n=1 Tax=Jiangella alkaliphila TaxID=419479 RepID=A0A1H2L7X8_9ACTN|nr:response regulator transcription factor [Jiangella alkaliphila]SDU77160.1 DNA-binding response regulator, OmpR family, contains REC and winged-helix (wHTH) domain [Jiangella alkaliphila]